MSEKNYKMFTDFYNTTVEKANDNDVAFIMNAIFNAAASKKKELEGAKKEDINIDNPKLDKHNAKIIRDFFEDFLARGNDDEAIYLIEGIKSLVDNMIKNPEEVARFVMYRKKEEAKKNAKKK